MREIVEHFVQIIRSLFPDDAQFHVFCKSNDYFIEIQWLLGTDPSRPNKPSRRIQIRFTSEVIEDYIGGDAAYRSRSDERLFASVNSRLCSFDPEHGETKQEGPPVEVWKFTTKQL